MIYISMHIIFNLEPQLTAQLLPELVNGTSNEDTINLICKAIVTEGVILTSYHFTWIKNNDSLDLSDSRYMVRTYVHAVHRYVHTIM